MNSKKKSRESLRKEGLIEPGQRELFPELPPDLNASDLRNAVALGAQNLRRMLDNAGMRSIDDLIDKASGRRGTRKRRVRE